MNYSTYDTKWKNYLISLKASVEHIQKQVELYNQQLANEFTERFNGSNTNYNYDVISIISFDATVLIDYITDLIDGNIEDKEYPDLQSVFFDYVRLRKLLENDKEHKPTKEALYDALDIHKDVFKNNVNKNTIKPKYFVNIMYEEYFTFEEFLLALKINGIDFFGQSEDTKQIALFIKEEINNE